ncbi:hypothetical protein PR048_016220 [Dryococelus australis]|uniref:Uncharacterized protein n=1 Tax=Dryococelus australis TaxID=614101 RepID=A0ABQ9HK91_9NEOP|nr:hypothetical protein PR048_016220 [Dryococelus australis]
MATQKKICLHVDNRMFYHLCLCGPGGIVVGLLASHHGEPRSIPGEVVPGFSHAGIAPDDAACWRVFSGVSRFHRPFIPAILHHTRLASPSSAVKTSRDAVGARSTGSAPALLQPASGAGEVFARDCSSSAQLEPTTRRATDIEQAASPANPSYYFLGINDIFLTISVVYVLLRNELSESYSKMQFSTGATLLRTSVGNLTPRKLTPNATSALQYVHVWRCDLFHLTYQEERESRRSRVKVWERIIFIERAFQIIEEKYWSGGVPFFSMITLECVCNQGAEGDTSPPGGGANAQTLLSQARPLYVLFEVIYRDTTYRRRTMKAIRNYSTAVTEIHCGYHITPLEQPALWQAPAAGKYFRANDLKAKDVYGKSMSVLFCGTCGKKRSFRSNDLKAKDVYGKRMSVLFCGTCGKKTIFLVKRPEGERCLRQAHRRHYLVSVSRGPRFVLRIESPPATKANELRFPAGSLPDFRQMESCRTMPLVGGVSSGISRFPLPCIPTLLHTHLFALIGS